MTRLENKTKEQLIKEVLKLQKQLDEEYESGFIWEGKAREEVNKLKQQLADAEDHIDALEIQLREQYQLVDEKDKEIKKLNWQLKDKDFIIKNLNHSLSVAPNANAGQRARIDELTKIVKEKDKEIEKLKQQYTILENENGKLTTKLIMDKYKKAQKEVSFGKQLAIQELEKVKKTLAAYVRADHIIWDFNVNEVINQQIKELKGEKDAEG